MKRQTLLPKLSFFSPLLIIITLLSVGGCAPARNRQTADAADSAAQISDLTAIAMNCADSALARMGREQKAAQLFIPAVYASADPYTLNHIRAYAESGVGGIVLLKGDSRSAAIIADSLSKWCEVPPFLAIDAEWGLVMRLADAPAFPPNARISKEADEEVMFDYGREMARECRRLGINMVLGPVLDVTAEGSFIGRRSFGNDPERVSDLAIAYARGLESGNVMSVAKHFPGHGAAQGDSHRRKPVIEKSLHSIDSIDLRPFRRYISQRLSGIMVGHMAFPAIDPEMLPAAVSHTVITDLLRDDLGFTGLILTDALNMLGAEGYGASKAVSAGADMILAPADTRAGIAEVLAAIGKGEINEADLDSHLRRILFRKYLLAAGYQPEISLSDTIASELERPETERIRQELR